MHVLHSLALSVYREWAGGEEAVTTGLPEETLK